MATKPELDPNLQLKANQEWKKIKAKAGFLGSIFGTDNIQLNIAGLICLILLTVATVYMCVPNTWKTADFTSKDFWGLVIPVITTTLGYLFGAHNNKN